jgi:hypothetical protein
MNNHFRVCLPVLAIIRESPRSSLAKASYFRERGNEGRKRPPRRFSPPAADLSAACTASFGRGGGHGVLIFTRPARQAAEVRIGGHFRHPSFCLGKLRQRVELMGSVFSQTQAKRIRLSTLSASSWRILRNTNTLDLVNILTH